MLSAFMIGCSTFHPAPISPRLPEPLPANISRHLNTPEQFKFNQLRDDVIQNWEVVSDNYKMSFDYYPHTGQRPKDLIVIFNILKDKHQTISSWIANNLLSAGYSCVIIRQEDFLSRKKLRYILPEEGAELSDWNMYFAQNLSHLGLILRHWLPSRPELSGRYSFVGVSMGGILAVGAAACFPNTQITICIMAGGDNYQLLSESEENLVASTYERLLDFYQTRYSTSRLEAAKKIQQDLESLDFIILNLARCVDTSKVRQIISLYDSSVPTETQWNLYEALGCPETRTYPSGHISLGLFAWSVRDQITKWIQDANPR